MDHIRKGSTQLIAFEETSNLLDRTFAACGYRWNGVLRQLYIDEIKEAKRERRDLAKKRYLRRPKQMNMKLEDKEFTTEPLIQGLREFEVQYQLLREELERTQIRNRQLEQRLLQKGDR